MLGKKCDPIKILITNIQNLYIKAHLAFLLEMIRHVTASPSNNGIN
jgi:hypothetical protein